jgi:hypothetical protein
VFRKLYEDGVCIVEDFFDDPNETGKANYPRPLFQCPEEQATFITKPGISRENIFDGVRRSCTTCGFDTDIIDDKKKIPKGKITGPGPRQQLKPCKVMIHQIPNLRNVHYAYDM